MSLIDTHSKVDVLSRHDIDVIITRFYADMLKDPIVGFIFTDVANINLEEHLPVIIDFWDDIVFVKNKDKKNYRGNALKKHIELNRLISLKPGHFTRWLFLFNKAIEVDYAGENADLMKARAEMVANSISAAVTEQKKGDMQLVLPKDSARN